MNNRVIRGVRRDQGVNIQSRRDDVRSFSQKLAQRCSTVEGTVFVFGILALGAFFSSVLPFVPELLFCLSIVVYFKFYGLKKKKWRSSLRLPAWLNKTVGNPVLDASTGKKAGANLYLGHDLDTGDQVWVNTSDTNKHGLMVGTTGSGKTEAIMGQSFGTVALGSGVMITDGKASVNTLGSLYKICRLFGRDEDIFVVDYLTGGKDIRGAQEHRRSHAYNPLAFGGSTQKSETMVALMDTGKDGGTDMWAGRAISFMEAVLPPLSYLNDKGYILLNPFKLGEFFLLQSLENLCLFGIFVDLSGNVVDLRGENGDPTEWRELQETLKALDFYLNQLPSYEICKPKKPWLPVGISDEVAKKFKADYKIQDEGANASDKEAQKKQANNDQSRQKVTEQHGYVTMQLVRAVLNLAINYGYIYNGEVSEISFQDMVLNRRCLVTLLPSLERSPTNLEQLGKLNLLSLKSVLGAMLNTPPEGRKRNIIDGNPANSKIPFLAVLDEIGYYMVQGTSVVPAQARSLGVAVVFGTQDVPSLEKASEAEGKAILDNTAVKYWGRLTSDEDSRTAGAAIKSGGKVHVQQAENMTLERGAMANHLRLDDSSSMREVSVIDYQDLTQQENGEFTVVMGLKGEDDRGRKTGGVTVVRLLAFYTGMIPDVEEWRRNPFCGVKPLTPIEIINLQDKVSSSYSLKQGYQQTLRELAGTAEDEHLLKVRELAVTLQKQRDGGFSILMNGKTDSQIEEYFQRRAQEMERSHVQSTRNTILNIFDGDKKDVVAELIDAHLNENTVGDKKAQEIMKTAQLVEDIVPT